MKKTINGIVYVTFLGISALSVDAQADITMYAGLQGGSGDVQNVMFNDLNSNDTALTIDGFLNQTREIVQFTGTELLSTPSGGQARVVAADGTFMNLSFRMADPTLGFDKVQFNVDAVSDGQINLTFTDQLGGKWTGLFPLDGAGQNYFTAVASKGQVISSVTLDSSVELTRLSDLAQVRLNPVGAAVVPEPGTMALVGLGMVCFGFLGNRKRKSKVVRQGPEQHQASLPE